MTTLREARARIHDGEPVFLVSSSAPLRCLPFSLEKLNAARFGPYDPARAAADTDPRPSAGRLSAYVTHCVVDLEWMGAPRGPRLAGEAPPSPLPRRRKWARATVQGGVGLCRTSAWATSWSKAGGCGGAARRWLASSGRTRPTWRTRPHTPLQNGGADGGPQTVAGSRVWVKPRCAKEEPRRSPLILLDHPSQTSDGIVQQATLGASPGPYFAPTRTLTVSGRFSPSPVVTRLFLSADGLMAYEHATTRLVLPRGLPAAATRRDDDSRSASRPCRRTRSALGGAHTSLARMGFGRK